MSDRRIPTIEMLRTEELAIVGQRDNQRIQIDWQFSVSDARHKMSSHYLRVNPDNQNHQSTYCQVAKYQDSSSPQ